MQPPRPLHLAVFGPGLIGGSVALAARRGGLCARLAVWSRDEAERTAARRRAGADLVTADPAEAAADADLLVLCTPPAALPGLARAVAPHLRPDAAVCDVASVKAGVVEELTAIFDRPGGSRYAGAHPMAGAERHGLAAARADLFAGSVCLLTPHARTALDALSTVETFWRGLGSRVHQLSPAAHDEAVALVSHLPHTVAAALAAFVGAGPGGGAAALACAGPNWWGMTRVAAGSPELWTEILSRNRGPVTHALRGLIGKLLDVLELVETGRDADLEAFLDEARMRRGASLPPADPAESSIPPNSSVETS